MRTAKIYWKSLIFMTCCRGISPPRPDLLLLLKAMPNFTAQCVSCFGRMQTQPIKLQTGYKSCASLIMEHLGIRELDKRGVRCQSPQCRLVGNFVLPSDDGWKLSVGNLFCWLRPILPNNPFAKRSARKIATRLLYSRSFNCIQNTSFKRLLRCYQLWKGKFQHV